jgi:hypothetical protein
VGKRIIRSPGDLDLDERERERECTRIGGLLLRLLLLLRCVRDLVEGLSIIRVTPSLTIGAPVGAGPTTKGGPAPIPGPTTPGGSGGCPTFITVGCG